LQNAWIIPGAKVMSVTETRNTPVSSVDQSGIDLQARNNKAG
jgi:hypothetical protein